MLLNVSIPLEISVAVIASAVTILTASSLVIMTRLLKRSAITIEMVDAVHEIAADVQKQVTTINAKSLANLADEDETRRIKAIPEAERSAGDREHLEAEQT